MDFDSYDNPDAEELLRVAERRLQRDSFDHRAAITQAGAAAVVLVLAGLIAGFGHSSRPLSVPALVATVVAFLVAARVHFPVAAGWTRPTQIAFVPMLFLLPVTFVPFVVMGCLLLDMTPQIVRGRLSLTRPLTLIADSAYSLGPVLVLALSGEQRFTWEHWPLYVLAFAAQVTFDIGFYAGRSWFAERTLPSSQLQVVWAYATDASLSCGGLLIAASADPRPGLVVLSVPLIAIFGLFARERQERMEHTLALSTAYRGTAQLLGDVIEDDDEYTGIHSRAVVDLAMAVADRLGIDALTKRNVEFGALLHDVGKIRVPKEIIRKPGRLTEAEWAIVRQHTIFGEEMLRRVGGTLSSVGKVVRHSHERWDGTGYPDGLEGERIPIEARIVCACDAFNAMTTNRPYRPAMALTEAEQELRRCSGSQFDPEVVAALLSELQEHPPVFLAISHTSFRLPAPALGDPVPVALTAAARGCADPPAPPAQAPTGAVSGSSCSTTS